MSNKTSISGRVLLAAVVALCVIVQSPLANAAEKVKIGVIGILAEAGLYVAAERGYFTKEGLDVEFVKGNVRSRCFSCARHRTDRRGRRRLRPGNDQRH